MARPWLLVHRQDGNKPIAFVVGRDKIVVGNQPGRATVVEIDGTRYKVTETRSEIKRLIRESE